MLWIALINVVINEQIIHVRIHYNIILEEVCVQYDMHMYLYQYSVYI